MLDEKKTKKWGFKYIRHLIWDAIERNGILDDIE